MKPQYLIHSNLIQLNFKQKSKNLKLKSSKETGVERSQVQGMSTQGEVEMPPRDILLEREVKGMPEIFCFYTFLCTSKICLKEKASFKLCKSAKVRMRLTFMPARPLPTLDSMGPLGALCWVNSAKSGVKSCHPQVFTELITTPSQTPNAR